MFEVRIRSCGSAPRFLDRVHVVPVLTRTLWYEAVADKNATVQALGYHSYLASGATPWWGHNPIHPAVPVAGQVRKPRQCHHPMISQLCRMTRS